MLLRQQSQLRFDEVFPVFYDKHAPAITKQSQDSALCKRINHPYLVEPGALLQAQIVDGLPCIGRPHAGSYHTDGITALAESVEWRSLGFLKQEGQTRDKPCLLPARITKRWELGLGKLLAQQLPYLLRPSGWGAVDTPTKG